MELKMNFIVQPCDLAALPDSEESLNVSEAVFDIRKYLSKFNEEQRNFILFMAKHEWIEEIKDDVC